MFVYNETTKILLMVFLDNNRSCKKMKLSESLQDYAFQEIKKRIQNGDYSPGTKLNTQEISISLGISRSPVLAAINRLIALGLVEAIPRKGAVVAKLSVSQIRNIIEARQMMELFCVKLAIKNVDYHPLILKEMESIVKDFETALEDGYPAAADLNTRFHTLYIALCGNQQIIKFYESNWSVGTMFYLYGIAHMPLSHHETAFFHHKEILNALKTKDEETLYKAIETHMSIIYETLEWYSQNVE